jgi:hypothetical protein
VSELGYFELVPGVYGTDEPGDTDYTTPEARAALQASAMDANVAVAAQRVPPSYGTGPSAPMWASQPGGGNTPIPGWTVQNATGPAFRSYDTTNLGITPDWTGDANSIAAGRYDQNQTVAYGDSNPLNQAPLGDGLLQYDDHVDNPNALPEDVGGQIELEY